MIKTLVQSIKLTGFAVIALAVIMGAMMGGSSLWSQFQGWQTEQFRSQFAFLSSAKGEFQQMAHKYEQRNLLSGTDVDWKAIL